MSDVDNESCERKANELDMSIIFVHGCDNEEMWSNLKQMSAYSEYKYLQNI